jgi:hypothetical protein
MNHKINFDDSNIILSIECIEITVSIFLLDKLHKLTKSC